MEERLDPRGEREDMLLSLGAAYAQIRCVYHQMRIYCPTSVSSQRTVKRQ